MFLIDLAFFDHCRPIIPLSQGLCYQGPGSDMVVTYTFMHLLEHLVGVFLSYAFKDGCRKASFIKGPPMNGELG